MIEDKQKLVIFGNAEIASLAKYYFEHDSNYDVVGFTVDDDYCESDSYEGLPLVPWSMVEKKFPSTSHHMHVALSYMKLNRLRQEKYEQARAANYSLASYVSSKSVTWPDLHIGDNCFILENQTIQPTCIIGNNVMLWSGNHIGHGTEIGDHSYISSHVVVSGHCTIGKRCFVGVNATLKDFLAIGDDCFIGMNASIVSDMPAESVAIGNKADVFNADDRRAKVLKKMYFKL